MTLPAAGVQNHGAVFTRRWVAEVLLDLAGYTADRDLGRMHLLEPSCGSGAFLGPAVERLIASAKGQGRDLAALGDAIRSYDLQGEHVQICRDLLIAVGQSAAAASALAERWVRRAEFLLSGIEDRPRNGIIGGGQHWPVPRIAAR